MKAGRELDTLVAEKVMGWTYRTFPDGACPLVKHWYCGEQYMLMQPFSTSIASAWQVVEKLKANGNNVWVEWAGTVWVCGTTSVFPDIEADTAPLAICLAALKACGVEMEKS